MNLYRTVKNPYGRQVTIPKFHGRLHIYVMHWQPQRLDGI